MCGSVRSSIVLGVAAAFGFRARNRGGIYGVSKMRILEGHRIVALTIVRATI